MASHGTTSIFSLATLVMAWTTIAIPSASAGPLPTGKKAIELVTANGERFRVGKVAFSGEGDRRSIRVDLVFRLRHLPPNCG